MSRRVIQCPHCAFKSVEKVLASKPLLTYQCLACLQPLRLDRDNDCCIVCRYSTTFCSLQLSTVKLSVMAQD